MNKYVFGDYVENMKTTGFASAFSLSPLPARSQFPLFLELLGITFILGQKVTASC